MSTPLIDAWSAVEVDTTAGTSHTPNTAAAAGVDCSILLIAAKATANGATAITFTPPAGWTLVVTSSEPGGGASASNATAVAFSNGQTSTVAPGAFTTNVSTVANIYHTVIREQTITSLLEGADDSVSVSDVATVVRSLHKTSSDSLSVSETPASTRSLQRTPSDAVGSVTDSISRLYAAHGIVTDSVAVSDAPTRISRQSQFITDAIGSVIDSIKRSVGLPKSVSESVSVADSLVAHRGVSRDAADSISTLSDAVTEVAQLPRAISEVVSVSDVLARIAHLPRSISESVSGFSDTATVHTGVIVVTANDSMFIADSVNSVEGLVRNTSDSVGSVSATPSRGLQLLRTLGESVSLTDSASRPGQHFAVSASDAVGSIISSASSGVTGFGPTVHVYQLRSYLGGAFGTNVNSLTMSFAGWVDNQQAMFDVVAALTLNNEGGLLYVCDNAIKKVLDASPYVLRVA